MQIRGGGMALAGFVTLWFVPAALGATGTQTFTSAGEHPFVVPPAVTSLDVTLIGGNGGVGNGLAVGGIGETVTATIAATPGELLYVEVGGDGVAASDESDGGAGGYGGGGSGGDTGFIFETVTGGGGGGASDVRTVSCGSPCQPLGPATLASRLLVAAGGGGGGGSANADNAPGGDGGAGDMSGQPGVTDGFGDAAGGAGLRATLAGGGGAGSGGIGINVATAGTAGAGGMGGTDAGSGGGGGGGGVYGGGGGGPGAGGVSPPTQSGGGGGGGGSSGVPAGASGVSDFSLVPTATGAEPSAALTWTLPPPTAVTTGASAVTSTTATVNGTVNPNDSQLTDCHFMISPAPPGGSSVPCSQQIPVGGTVVPVSAQLLGLTPSTMYTVTLSAANAIGPASGAAVSFTTLPPGVGAGPVISGLRVAHRIHRRVRKHHKPPTTITLTLSQPAKLTFTFTRKHHHRYVAAGSLAVNAKAGVDRLAFAGRLRRGRLKPGRYRVAVIATNGAGRSSAPRDAGFTLV